MHTEDFRPNPDGATVNSSPLADRRQHSRIILVLGALSAVSPFSIDMYLPAFARIAEDLGTAPARIALSLSSYFIGLSIGQLLYGPLLDRFGRKKPLYLGLAIYVAVSLAIVRARDVETLVALRFLQGLGGCAAQVAAMSMVRDFFPVEEGAKVFSLLILILGASPLLAPTIGGFVVAAFGWQAVFLALAALVAVVLFAAFRFLPPAREPDRSVDLAPGPIFRTYLSILRERRFATYAFAGAFSFGGLFVYVAGSPIIFMDLFRVSPQAYGAIFAALSVGFIGSSQLNVGLTKRYSSERLFKTAIALQTIVAAVFFAGSAFGGYGLWPTVGFLFASLACLGVANPNAAALALAPFERNVGSAAALLGFLQIGVGALASTGVGLFDVKSVVPLAGLLFASSGIGLLVLRLGRAKAPRAAAA